MKKTTSGPTPAECDKIGADLAAEFAANPELAQEGDSTPADWPLDMHVALIAGEYDVAAVRAFLTHFVISRATCEELEDAARELGKRNLSHIGDVLLEFAKGLPSEVEAEINRPQPEHYDNKTWADKLSWHINQWLRRRMKISGESWNELVHKHHLEEWTDPIEPDVICRDDRWYAVGANGELVRASTVKTALFITPNLASPTHR